MIDVAGLVLSGRFGPELPGFSPAFMECKCKILIIKLTTVRLSGTLNAIRAHESANTRRTIKTNYGGHWRQETPAQKNRRDPGLSLSCSSTHVRHSAAGRLMAFYLSQCKPLKHRADSLKHSDPSESLSLTAEKQPQLNTLLIFTVVTIMLSFTTCLQVKLLSAYCWIT